MASIYFKYPKNNLVQINDIRRVKIDTVLEVIRQILPTSSTHILQYKTVEDGFFFAFKNDTDVNPLFIQENLNKFKKLNLTLTLSSATKNNREVYLPGVSNTSYYLSNDQLLDELEKNDIKPLFINKFISTGGIRYIVVTAATTDSRNSIVKNSVKILDQELKPQPKLNTRFKQQQQQTPSQYSSRIRSGPTHQGSIPKYCLWGGPVQRVHEVSYITPSAQGENRALPINSTWGGGRRAPLQPPQLKTGLVPLQRRPRVHTPVTPKPAPAQQKPQQIPVIQSPQALTKQQEKQQTTSEQQTAPHQQTTSQHQTIPQKKFSSQQTSPQRRTTPPIKKQDSPSLVKYPQPSTHKQQQIEQPQTVPALSPQINTGKCVVETLSIVSEALSRGIEHPDIYLDIFNICISQKGYASVRIPKTALDISKNVFHYKNPGVNKINIPFSALFTTPVHTST